MKNILIIESNKRKLESLESTIKLLDPSQQKYTTHVNPYGNGNLPSVPFLDILDKLKCNALDLIVLPLEIGSAPNIPLNENPQGYVEQLQSVRTSFSYAEQGYQGHAVLTMEGMNPFNLEIGLNSTEKDFKQRIGEEDNSWYNIILGTTFLNVYSVDFPEITKIAKFRNYLEGTPQMAVSIMNLNTRRVTEVKPEPETE